MVAGEFVPSLGIGSYLTTDHAKKVFLCGGKVGSRYQPCLKTRPKLIGFLFGYLRKDDVAVLIHRDPFAGGRVDMVVDIN